MNRKELADNVLLMMDIYGYDFDTIWYDYVSDDIRDNHDREAVRRDVDELEKRRRNDPGWNDPYRSI